MLRIRDCSRRPLTPNPHPLPHPTTLRWGYSVAALRVGIKHFAWQQIQIEPSAAWHQDVNSQARHYTILYLPY